MESKGGKKKGHEEPSGKTGIKTQIYICFLKKKLFVSILEKPKNSSLVSSKTKFLGFEFKMIIMSGSI